ncbi:MAG: hypothetical protein LUG98_00505 [Tannerellaceae bacterium]|nr:hypothetical protein [Tannerellaceae bacterium]
MKQLSFLWLCLMIAFSGYGQLDTGDYKTIVIQKKLSEFPLKVDLSTPMNSYLSREYIMWSGEERLWYDISTYQFAAGFDPDAPNREVSPETQEAILNYVVEEMVIYKDSAAAVLTYDPAESEYRINLSRLEDGIWVNMGLDFRRTLEACRERLPFFLETGYSRIPVIARVKQKPADVGVFVEYIQKNGQSPVEFVLGALAEKKIVIYGEYHRRKVSWDLLREVIRDPRFIETTGTVFMEEPSHMQPVMDQFMAGHTMDPELILQIFRETQPQGWWDRGEFEFLTDLWELNSKLPADQKIQVKLADFQLPYSRFQTKEEKDAFPDMDRNLHMADVIEQHVKATTGTRNHLFIVGCGHAYKSHVPGFASTPRGQKVELTAGAQLVERFSDDEVFTIFQHVVTSDNNGRSKKLIRHGFFDRAFELAGNQPVAFNLKGSPFGAEPFDGVGDGVLYDPRAGSFADNYDGYIFLQPLKEEESDYVLLDIFTNEFVEEIKRRAAYFGMAPDSRYWFGLQVQEMTPETIKSLWDSNRGKKRYPAELFEWSKE